jgi:hypothetical protein
MYIRQIKVISISLFIIINLSACQKSAKNDDNPSNPPSNGSSSEFTSNCGTVVDEKIKNPVKRKDGEAISVKEILGSNLVGLSDNRLVKLAGIGPGALEKREAAKNMIAALSSDAITYFQASDNCTVQLINGATGSVGQLFTSDGKSFSEELLKAGLVDVDSNDVCGANQLASCYNALKSSDIKSAGEIHKFLWKPLSDTKGDVAVIHELHCNTIAYINGQEFRYAGSGNGRCGTFVGTKPGCAYGTNIKIEFIDKDTGKAYFHKGQPYVIVPNGCARFEFE